MIHLKLGQAGERVNHKRVERLYRLEEVLIRRRQRKKTPVADRQPLHRSGQANEVWSMDFAFDRIASGRTLKCLVIVDDSTHEPIAILPEHTIGGEHLTRLFDSVCSLRGRPKVIRTDNGPEFTGKAMLTWAHRIDVTLRLIEPGKPNQNAYVELFIGRFRDECLNEHWFTTLEHARTIFETWRTEYIEERPKRSMGGQTPLQFASQLARRAVKTPEGSDA